MYPGFKYEGYAWGLAIGLNSCIGCSACIVACVAETHPVVGKEQVARQSRDALAQVDTYYKGGERNPKPIFNRFHARMRERALRSCVSCRGNISQCRMADRHDLLHRCVGTRYCSNNCPYKFRRFNFLLYQDFYTASLKMMPTPTSQYAAAALGEVHLTASSGFRGPKSKSELEDRKVRKARSCRLAHSLPRRTPSCLRH